MTDVYESINVDLSGEKSIGLPQVIDDLTKIKGIGSGSAEKLNARKIFTYRQLAEITPEKLSEAPGIGIATARKFIEEAKNLLSKSQEIEIDSNETFEVAEVIVEEELPQEELQIEEKPSRTIEKQWFGDKFNRSRLTASYPPISKRPSEETEVDENFEPKEDTLQRNNTPYKQLLARSEDKVENAFSEIEDIGIEPISESESKSEFEVEMVEEVEETEGEEEVEEVENDHQEKVPVRFENDLIEEPFESEASVPIKENRREEYIIPPTYTEFPEVSVVSEVPEVPEVLEVPEETYIPEIPEVPTRLRAPSRREDLTSEIDVLLKDVGYYSIPSSIKGLRQFFQNVDYIGLKHLRVNDNSKLLILVPIKFCELEGNILIDEKKIDLKTYSKASESDLARRARLYVNDLLEVKDAMFEDVVNGDKFRDFFQECLRVRFTSDKNAKNKNLYFFSGQTEYKVLIEPIMLTKNPAKCLEKSLIFPYQRKSNLHVINRSNIIALLRFLEKKYHLIESRTKKSNSIEIYQKADNKFRSSLRITSLPFLGYSVVLLFIYISQFYFLLKLFNSVGFAVIGIYFFAATYFYFRFYKTKKELKTEFKTPYFMQNLQFSEIDLLCVKEEFTDEQMAQFGYECFGKDNDSKVLEQIDKDTIKENIEARRQEQEAPHLYEVDADLEYSLIKNESKSEIKYSSFLDD